MRPVSSDDLIYEIVVLGHLDQDWSDWLSGLAIETLVTAEGRPLTKISGSLPDQSALVGLLIQLTDLNVGIVSINRVAVGNPKS